MDNLKLKKSLGQNFLLDDNYLRGIVSSLNLPKNANILEIGAGIGNLSRILSESFKKVISFEIDKRFTKDLTILRSKLSNFTFVMQDILRTKVLDIEKMFNGEEYFIVANLPYYITSPVIFHFIFDSTHLKKLFVMVQEEVARRYIAKPKTRQYGIPSVLLQTFCSVRIIKEVKRELFTPIPKVDSCMIEIDINRDKFKKLDTVKYQKFVSHCFRMKRKTLVNNLCSMAYKREDILDVFNSLHLLPTCRPEEIETDKFIQLFKLLVCHKTE